MRKTTKKSIRWNNIAKITAGMLLISTYALGYGREDGEWLRITVIQILGGRA
jgi:hypothetical protein